MPDNDGVKQDEEEEMSAEEKAPEETTPEDDDEGKRKREEDGDTPAEDSSESKKPKARGETAEEEKPKADEETTEEGKAAEPVVAEPAPVLPSKEGISVFHDSDVLSGRGGGTNVHPRQSHLSRSYQPTPPFLLEGPQE